MSTNPQEVVETFLAKWGVSFKSIIEAVRTTFTDKTVYENVGLAVTHGIDEAVAFLEIFPKTMGFETCRINTLHIASTGHFVLTERIDSIHGVNGEKISDHPLMGVFEVKEEKIVAWRDYFDSAHEQPEIMVAKDIMKDLRAKVMGAK